MVYDRRCDRALTLEQTVDSISVIAWLAYTAVSCVLIRAVSFAVTCSRSFDTSRFAGDPGLRFWGFYLTRIGQISHAENPHAR
jgi:hypothetical protein